MSCKLGCSDEIQAFIDRVNRLEKRYKRDKYVEHWLMPADLMKAIRDELIGRQQELFKENEDET